jgi:hypothetical protein
MDIGASSHVEGTCEKEKASGYYRPDFEANRRRDPTKSVQYWTIARLARLNYCSDLQGQVIAAMSIQAPPIAGLFRWAE